MLTCFSNQRPLIVQTAFGLTRLSPATTPQECLFCATFIHDPRLLGGYDPRLLGGHDPRFSETLADIKYGKICVRSLRRSASQSQCAYVQANRVRWGTDTIPEFRVRTSEKRTASRLAPEPTRCVKEEDEDALFVV
jgi:hypothetical protein